MVGTSERSEDAKRETSHSKCRWSDSNAALIAVAPEMYKLLEAIAADPVSRAWHLAVNRLLAKADSGSTMCRCGQCRECF